MVGLVTLFGRFITTIFAIVATLVFASTAVAAPFTEIGDAGDLPPTAQVVEGFGPLDSITGTLFNVDDADMYEVFVTGGGTFSATTNPVVDPVAGADFDTQLFLFDSDGFGVYANDDDPAAPAFESTLPASDLLTPVDPGVYLLLVTAFDYDPMSVGGEIFTDFPADFELVVGPDGPGGASPIIGYDGSGDIGNYTIALAGAEFVDPVPEPATLLLFASGMVAMGSARRRNRQK